jgi:uncharacterized membrane protein
MPGKVTLFGAPISDFGFFASILIAVVAGFLTFFGMTFLSIVGVSIYKGITHSPVTLDVSYKYIAFPTAVVVLAGGLVFMMALWVRRMRAGG